MTATTDLERRILDLIEVPHDLYIDYRTREYYATDILSLVGLTRNDFPRLRNVFIDTESKDYDYPIIYVCTRTGAGNREDYEDEHETLQESEYYLHDEEMEDPTYIEWYFRIPDSIINQLVPRGR